jgi:hypothetical protein
VERLPAGWRIAALPPSASQARSAGEETA